MFAESSTTNLYILKCNDLHSLQFVIVKGSLLSIFENKIFYKTAHRNQCDKKRKQLETFVIFYKCRFRTYLYVCITRFLFILFLLTANMGLIYSLFKQYSQSGLPPLRPLCGEAPGRDSNPGRADLMAGSLTTRPPHLTKTTAPWHTNHISSHPNVLYLHIYLSIQVRFSFYGH